MGNKKFSLCHKQSEKNQGGTTIPRIQRRRPSVDGDAFLL